MSMQLKLRLMFDIRCFRQRVPSLVKPIKSDNRLCSKSTSFFFFFPFVTNVSFRSLSEKAFPLSCFKQKGMVLFRVLERAHQVSCLFLVCSTSAHACKPRSLRTSPWSTTAPSRPCLRRKSPSSEPWLAASHPTHLYHYLPREGQRCVR